MTGLLSIGGSVVLASGLSAAAANAVTVNYWAGTGIDSHALLFDDQHGSAHQLTQNAARVLNVNGYDKVCIYATRNGSPDTATVCDLGLAQSTAFAGTVTRVAHVYPTPNSGHGSLEVRAKYDY